MLKKLVFSFMVMTAPVLQAASETPQAIVMTEKEKCEKLLAQLSPIKTVIGYTLATAAGGLSLFPLLVKGKSVWESNPDFINEKNTKVITIAGITGILTAYVLLVDKACAAYQFKMLILRYPKNEIPECVKAQFIELTPEKIDSLGSFSNTLGCVVEMIKLQAILKKELSA